VETFKKIGGAEALDRRHILKPFFLSLIKKELAGFIIFILS